MYLSKAEKVDLERDYLPSMHTIRFQNHDQPSEAVIEHFINLTTKQSSDLHDNPKIRVRANVRYAGTDDRQLVDIFYPAGSSEHGTPLFVHVHGGYWQISDKSSAGSFVAPLIERGYRVLVMDYNNCPEVTLSQLTAQFENFLKWVFAYAAETLTTEISFSGHSAGGHLLAHLLYTPVVTPKQIKLIKAIFLICGVYDLRELWQMELVNPNNLLNIDAELSEKLSPLCWPYDENSNNNDNLKAFRTYQTPVHVLVAEHDSESFIGQSYVYAKHLQKLNYNAHYKLFDNYDHFDIVEEGNEEGSQITNYMRQVLGK